MGSQVIEKTASTSADPDVVYALLRDGATVELVPGRRFNYFAPKLPGMGWLIRRRLAGVTERFVKGLAARAAAVDRGPWPRVRHA